MKLYFVTVSKFKSCEVREYFRGSGINLEIIDYQIQEILHKDLEVIVEDKLTKAFIEFRVPCAVEHGGLFIDALNGLPGGLSKVVWDSIGDRLCGFMQPGDSRAATAKSVIGYCDGQKRHLFVGETRGVITDCGRGGYEFQWDPIFIPDGSARTNAEMGFPEKAKYSQAAKGWAKLIKFLKNKH
jgi:XTP/dITP diphosphohydrolase